MIIKNNRKCIIKINGVNENGCEYCRGEKENKGRNLCRNCYAKELRKGNLFKYERIYKKK